MSEIIGDAASNAFNPIALKELATYNEEMKSAASSSYDIKSWETLTQAHKNFRKNTTNAKIKEVEELPDNQGRLNQTKNEDLMQQHMFELKTPHGGANRRRGRKK